MNSSPQRPRRGFEAFQFRDFRRYQLARVVAILGGEAQTVAVAWQIYSITHRAIDLGYAGLVMFLPGLVFLLPAGHVADRFDRRQVILVCYVGQAAAALALIFLARAGVARVWPIYLVLFFIGTSRAFSGPAAQALLPHLVPEDHFVNAVTWGGAIFQFANVAGPALGGLLFTLPLAHWVPETKLEGAGIVYVFALASLGWFLVLVATLHARPGRMEHRALSLRVVLAGFDFVRRSPLLLGSFSLDLVVVLLGGSVALMPIFAREILNAGPRGLGMLRAAPAVGAVLTSLLLTRVPLGHRAGRKLFVAVALFGAATIVFGLSRNLSLSLAALAVLGGADMVSVIIRGSIMQLSTPVGMRGRVGAVNSLFIGASNELGSFESGLTAQWWGAVRATIVGGVGALAVAGVWAALFPALRRADELTGAALRPPARAADAGKPKHGKEGESQ